MVQQNLSGGFVKAGDTVNGRKVTPKDAEGYNRFYNRAFESGEIEEILERGGGESLNNFKKISKEVMAKRDFWDVMFSRTFKGRDTKVRASKFPQELGKTIYEQYFPKDRRSEVKTYSIRGKNVSRLRVRKGNKLTFSGKVYRGGQFLPKRFIEE